MEVVQGDVHPGGQPHSRVRESLRRQAVHAIAVAPGVTLPIHVGEVAQRIEAVAESHPTTRGRAIGVVIAGVVQRRVVVEVFLNVDQGVALDLAADDRRIRRRVAARERLEQSGDVVGEGGKTYSLSLRLVNRAYHQGRTEQELRQTSHGVHLVSPPVAGKQGPGCIDRTSVGTVCYSRM